MFPVPVPVGAELLCAITATGTGSRFVGDVLGLFSLPVARRLYGGVVGLLGGLDLRESLRVGSECCLALCLVADGRLDWAICLRLMIDVAGICDGEED